MVRRFNYGLSDEEVKELEEAFNLFDTDDSKLIDPKDLKAAMISIGFDTKCPSVYNIISNIEHTYNGKIDFNQFLEGINLNIGDKYSKDGIRKIFALIDEDKTGKISFKNIKALAEELGEKLTDEEIKEIISRVDMDGDGEISFEEFYTLMVQHSVSNT